MAEISPKSLIPKDRVEGGVKRTRVQKLGFTFEIRDNILSDQTLQNGPA